MNKSEKIIKSTQLYYQISKNIYFKSNGYNQITYRVNFNFSFLKQILTIDVKEFDKIKIQFKRFKPHKLKKKISMLKLTTITK